MKKKQKKVQKYFGGFKKARIFAPAFRNETGSNEGV